MPESELYSCKSFKQTPREHSYFVYKNKRNYGCLYLTLTGYEYRRSIVDVYPLCFSSLFGTDVGYRKLKKAQGEAAVAKIVKDIDASTDSDDAVEVSKSD